MNTAQYLNHRFKTSVSSEKFHLELQCGGGGKGVESVDPLKQMLKYPVLQHTRWFNPSLFL